MGSTIANNSGAQVLIERTFNAPPELVFQAWTSAERLQRWYAPQGCTITDCKVDFRQGGEVRQCIRTPDGHACWVKGVYLEILKPERIVFTMVNTDPSGNRVEPVSIGMDPEWPGETVVTVTFQALPGGQTRMTLHQTVLESVAKRTGAYPSWFSMLDRLELDLAGK